MKTIWKLIKNLHDNKAVHKKKQIPINEIEPYKILAHAAEELIELASEPGDVFEMADIFGCLIHYCIIQEWTPGMMEKAIIQKLSERIEYPKKKSP